MKLYMKTTTDKYELPIAVADSKRELASMLNMKFETLRVYMSKHLYGYITVEVDINEDLQ